MTSPMRRPPPVSPGDAIAVVAPSSPFPRPDFLAGLAWLRQRYRIKARSDVFARDGYLAGSDDRRRAELAGAMSDPEVRAIVVARGGYGLTRILDDLPWGQLEARPRWICGFSDVTALHAIAWARGLCSLHAPHVTGLARASPAVRAAFVRALERPGTPDAWTGLEVIHPGPAASGPLVGGNLALVEALAAAGRLVIPPRAVLALEDVTERPYRIDRMLTSLRLGGWLRGVSALIFGTFTQCEPGPDGRAVEHVLRERTLGLGIPVLAGAPFGHGEHNAPFVLGAEVHVEGASVRLAD